MKTKPKNLVRQKMSGSAETHSRTLLTVRDLIDVSDEPEERGGTNEGIAPTEMFGCALIACTNVISHKVAKKHGIDLKTYDLQLDCGFNRLGVTLQEEVDLPFPDMTLTIEVATDASPEKMTLLAKELAMYCPVSKMIEAAGTRLKTIWIINGVQKN